MRKGKVLGLAVLIMGLLSGCEKFEPEETAISVDNKGQVVSYVLQLRGTGSQHRSGHSGLQYGRRHGKRQEEEIRGEGSERGAYDELCDGKRLFQIQQRDALYRRRAGGLSGRL